MCVRVFARACVARARGIKQVGTRSRKFFQIARILSRFLRTKFFSIGVCVYSHTITVYFCVCLCVCVHPPPPHSAFLYFCARASLHARPEEGDCNKLCNFSAVAVAFKIKLALKSPLLTPAPSLTHYHYFLLFPSSPPPSFSLPFSGPAREFRKEAWVLFSLPLHPFAIARLSETYPCPVSVLPESN